MITGTNPTLLKNLQILKQILEKDIKGKQLVLNFSPEGVIGGAEIVGKADKETVYPKIKVRI